MKKFLPLLTGLGMGFLAILVIFAFVLQLRSSSVLKKELDAKKEEFKDAQVASRKMEALERKSQELKQKESKMLKRVAVGETQPLDLIRAITGSAGKMGLRQISFDLKAPSAGSAPGKEKKAPPPPGNGPQPVHFQMKFNATFPQTLKFIKELNNLERIVRIEKIEVARSAEILPYQAVILDLTAYFFVGEGEKKS